MPNHRRMPNFCRMLPAQSQESEPPARSPEPPAPSPEARAGPAALERSRRHLDDR
jgi:hypothetical protein